MTDDLETGKNTKEDEEFAAPETGGIDDAENPEFELTPEIEEKIMDKVQDINKTGVAFHWDIYNRKEEMLKDGIFGYGSKEIFLEKRKKSIYFNVTGKINEINMWRKFNPEDQRTDIELSYFSDLGGYLSSNKSELIILFDYSNMTFNRDQKAEPKMNIYKTQRTGYRTPLMEVSGINGFETFGRISPNRFTGLALATFKEADSEKRKINHELNNEFDSYQKDVLGIEHKHQRLSLHNTNEVFDNNLIPEKLKDLVLLQLHTNKSKQERLIPIYDSAGNLLWPRQMSYKDVKNYVEKRDSKGETKEIEDKGGNSKGGQKGVTKRTSEEKDEAEGLDGDNAI